MALIRFPFKSTCLDHTPARQSQPPVQHTRNKEGNLHSIKLVTLNTHIPRPQMLHPPPPHLHRDRLFKDHKRLVPLANDPLIRFLLTRRIGRHEHSRPERVLASSEVRKLGSRGLKDQVEPVERGLQVEVVPEAVAENEGVGFGGFGGAEDVAEAGEFFGGDGEADHLFNWGVVSPR